MPDFLWKAANASGQLSEGKLAADSQTQALLALRAQGLTPLQVSPVGGSDSVSAAPGAGPVPTGVEVAAPQYQSFFGPPKVAASDISAMTSELSIMLKAGLSLDNALRVLVGMSANPAVIELNQGILDEVKGGSALSKVLARRPQHFSDFYVNMVKSGEVSGQLSAVLERLTEHLERISALRASIISATIYPAILLAVAVISVVMMLGFVVPQFETLFNGMGDALPTATRVVMNIGKAFKEFGLVIVLGVFLVGVAVRQWLRSAGGLAWWQKRQLALPVLGNILRKYDLTLYARALGTLIGNGVPMVQSLQIATQSVGNLQLRKALDTVIPKVKAGTKMADALRATAIFEPLALSLVRVGEETGRLGPMFLEMARLSDRDVEAGIKRGLVMLEPLLILVLGFLIASIIVSILLGILSINDLAV